MEKSSTTIDGAKRAWYNDSAFLLGERKVFDERKHKRVPKGTAEGGQFAGSDGSGGTRKATFAEEKRMKELGLNKSSSLSKQEWAIFYERIGKIKNEGHNVTKTTMGDMIIPIETNDSNVIVIANGTYQNPKVKNTLRCKSNDHMYEIIARLEKL